MIFRRMGRKVCYTGHRRLLPLSHKWRKDKTNFDGSVDNREPIAPKSGDEVLHDIDCSIGVSHSVVNKKKRKYLEGTKGWNKKSVFFNLSYWAKLKVRHNIDIMHVVKNVTAVVNKKKRKYLEGTKGWNKKSVFFNLPYWAKLKVRHNIDI
nr:hypothetical protein [Tanacetum cinerariifolium]